LKDVTDPESSLANEDVERKGKVKLTICDTFMLARFKVNTCKSKVVISPSHNRPTKKMWRGSVPISEC
jgi:hypothetical protein